MTRSVPVYHVEYALKVGDKWEPQIVTTRDPGEADSQARMRGADPAFYACVKVTGPHPHEVPE